MIFYFVLLCLPSLGISYTGIVTPELQIINGVPDGSPECSGSLCICYKNMTDCSGRNLVEVPSTAVQGTVVLLLNNNRITTILQNTFLGWDIEQLSLSNNQISTLNVESFASLSRLRILDLSHNNLGGAFSTNILHAMPNLSTLSLSHNNLIGINIAPHNNGDRRNPMLTTLYVSNNKLANLAAETFVTSLFQTLDLSNNLIEQSPFLPQGVIYADLRGNTFNTFAENVFAKIQNLQTLRFGQAQLDLLNDNNLVGLRSLQVLEITDSVVTGIPTGFFMSAPKITHLELRNLPRLRTIPFASNLTILSLENLPSATTIMLPNTLQHLYVRNCPLLELENLASVLPLVTLTLIQVNLMSGKSIGDLSSLTSLRDFLWEESNVTVFNSGDYFVSGQLPSLGNINLGRNFISRLETTTFQNLNSLSSIDLSRNRITSVDLNALRLQTNLENLILSDNLITTLYNSGSAGGSLRTLKLARNMIVQLDPSVFQNLPAVISVDLTSNRLTSLEGLNITSDYDVSIHTNDNPWDCSCDFLTLYESLAQRLSFVCDNDISETYSCLRCRLPQAFAGTFAHNLTCELVRGGRVTTQPTVTVASASQTIDPTTRTTTDLNLQVGQDAIIVIAATVCGLLVLCAVAVLIAWCVCRKRRSKMGIPLTDLHMRTGNKPPVIPVVARASEPAGPSPEEPPHDINNPYVKIGDPAVGETYEKPIPAYVELDKKEATLHTPDVQKRSSFLAQQLDGSVPPLTDESEFEGEYMTFPEDRAIPDERTTKQNKSVYEDGYITYPAGQAMPTDASNQPPSLPTSPPPSAPYSLAHHDIDGTSSIAQALEYISKKNGNTGPDCENVNGRKLVRDETVYLKANN